MIMLYIKTGDNPVHSTSP